MKSKLFVVFFLISIPFLVCGGRDRSDVILVVVGSGQTKEEATTVALRSAVEQTYGVFVSASTEILNDELLKDDIATVASGNIQSYREVSSQVMPDGQWVVSLSVNVSPTSLVSYAKSKGSQCEFAGAAFGANLKLLKLNRINSERVFDNLLHEVELMSNHMYDYRLTVGEPSVKGDVEICVDVFSNKTTEAISNLLAATIKEVAMDDQYAKDIMSKGERINAVYIFRPTPSQETMKRYASLKYMPTSVLYLYSEPLLRQFNVLFSESLWNFEISDNLGNKYKLCDGNYELQHLRSEITTYDGPLLLYEGEYSHTLGSGKNNNVNGVSMGVTIGMGRVAKPAFILPLFKQKSKGKKKESSDSIQMFQIRKRINIPIERLEQISSFEINPR